MVIKELGLDKVEDSKIELILSMVCLGQKENDQYRNGVDYRSFCCVPRWAHDWIRCKHSNFCSFALEKNV